MNISRIAERLVSPVDSIEKTMGNGFPVSEDVVQAAWSGVRQKFGFISDKRMSVGKFIQAYDKFSSRLEGTERWMANEMVEVAHEAVSGNWTRMSGPDMIFATVRSACSSCLASRRLMGFSVRVSGRFSGLRSRRDVMASMRKADKWKSLPDGWTRKSRQKFWDSLVGNAEHKTTLCMQKMEGHVSDPGAFCGSLRDRVEKSTAWRGE